MAATITVAASYTTPRGTTSERAVRRLTATGELPVHRLGHLVRISEADLARFLAARRSTTAALSPGTKKPTQSLGKPSS